MSFNIVSIVSSNRHFFRHTGYHLVILVEGIMRINWLAVQNEMQSKDFSLFSSASFFVQWSRNVWAIFGRGPDEDHLCEIILNLGQKFKRRCCLKIFLFLALAAILFFFGGGGECLVIVVESLMRNIYVKLF